MLGEALGLGADDGRGVVIVRAVRGFALFGVLLAGAVVGVESAVASAVAGSDGRGGCGRPYSAGSPWNTPIGPDPALASNSRARVRAIGGHLSSDPSQYTYPVYRVSAKTRRVRVHVSGVFSRVSAGGRRLTNRVGGASVRVPLPPGARAAAGNDSQIILVDRRSGWEWGFFEFRREGGRYVATNGYRYNTRWSAVAPVSGRDRVFAARGAGIPYLAGLVRRCEIKRGRITHALAFAYDAPRSDFVFPASKSDGASRARIDLPEGARLQLNPKLTPRKLEAMGCHGACLTIARALQRYGMYVVDNSGRSKVMIEFDETARWRGAITANTVQPLQLKHFRVLRFPPRRTH